MEKLRLKNGTEFEMVPMGLEVSANAKSFVFTSKLSHGEIKELLVGINEIDYILADGSCISYMDIVGLISLEENIQNGTYTAVFCTDLTARLFKELKAEIEDLKALKNTTQPAEPEDESEGIEPNNEPEGKSIEAE